MKLRNSLIAAAVLGAASLSAQAAAMRELRNFMSGQSLSIIKILPGTAPGA